MKITKIDQYVTYSRYHSYFILVFFFKLSLRMRSRKGVLTLHPKWISGGVYKLPKTYTKRVCIHTCIFGEKDIHNFHETLKEVCISKKVKN